MTDSWDDDYVNDLDEGHAFADRYLSDEPRSAMHAMHRSETDPHFDRDAAELNISPGAQGQARRIQPGIIEAKFPGTCRSCLQRIDVNDPIMSDGNGGWRHAGCGSHRPANRYEMPF